MKPIRFALLATLIFALTAINPSQAEDAKPDADGFISLFDGKTLDG